MVLGYKKQSTFEASLVLPAELIESVTLVTYSSFLLKTVHESTGLPSGNSPISTKLRREKLNH